jgi:hypothetical protein
MRYILASSICLALMAAPAGATGSNLRLSAQVPVICKLSYQSEVSQEGSSFRLGQIKQYCNSPSGFAVSVDYSPGSLRDTTLRIGHVAVMLDGSGHAELFRSDGPKVEVLDVSAIPSSTGFDSDQLNFHIEPI